MVAAGSISLASYLPWATDWVEPNASETQDKVQPNNEAAGVLDSTRKVTAATTTTTTTTTNEPTGKKSNAVAIELSTFNDKSTGATRKETTNIVALVAEHEV